MSSSMESFWFFARLCWYSSNCLFRFSSALATMPSTAARGTFTDAVAASIILSDAILATVGGLVDMGAKAKGGCGGAENEE